MSPFSAFATLIDNTICPNIWDLETKKAYLMSLSDCLMVVAYIVSKIKISTSDRIIVVSLLSVFSKRQIMLHKANILQ